MCKDSRTDNNGVSGEGNAGGCVSSDVGDRSSEEKIVGDEGGQSSESRRSVSPNISSPF